MKAVSNPNRSPVFRLITIASSALGSFVIGMWGLKSASATTSPACRQTWSAAIIAALCALAAGLASLSFFAGVDESVGYVFKETQIDKLTGLNARIAMVGKIAEAAAATIRTGEPVFLIDIDIDRFKQINDSIGYSQGDELIRAFAQRLQASLPDKGGDRPHRRRRVRACSTRTAGDKADGPDRRELIETLMEPYQLLTHLQSVNLSVGIVAMPKDGTDPVLLLRRSNLALQHARARGIGNWSVIPARHGPGRRLPAMDRVRTACGVPARRLRPALPAAARPGEGHDRRLRGADPLASSRARHDRADGVHPDRRGDRHDPADRRMGAEACLQRRPVPARGMLRRHQHLAGAVHGQGLHRHRARRDQVERDQAANGSSWKSPRPR